MPVVSNGTSIISPSKARLPPTFPFPLQRMFGAERLANANDTYKQPSRFPAETPRDGEDQSQALASPRLLSLRSDAIDFRKHFVTDIKVDRKVLATGVAADDVREMPIGRCQRLVRGHDGKSLDMLNSDAAGALIAVSDAIELKLDLPFATCCAESSISQKPETGSSFELCGRLSPNGPR
jgi:hypothetical protein